MIHRVSKSLIDCSSHCVCLGERAQWAHLFIVDMLGLLLIGWVQTDHQSWGYKTRFDVSLK
jgi:hypothetical protein